MKIEIFIYWALQIKNMDYLKAVQQTMTRNEVTKNKDSYKEDMEEQRRIFERHISINRQKINSLEKEVEQLKMVVQKTTEFMNKMNDSEAVAKRREALHSRRERPPSDRPIDRNGVAPSDVQIRDIFYAGRR